MKTKVYYGEYTLKHWVDLINSKNIVLPEYQRNLSWKKENIINFIKSLSLNEFIPPVTIASMKVGENEKKNFIIDGQQRLTGLLLFYHEKYPKVEFFNEDKIHDCEDDSMEDSEKKESSKVLKWRFDQIAGKGDDEIEKDKYEKLKVDIDEDKNDFFEKHYLGFSYIVPNTDADENEQTHYYASVFRNINISRVGLTAIESRRSLYFMDKKYKDFFDSDILSSSVIKNITVITKLDAIRYYSLLSQYHKVKDDKKVGVGFGGVSKREKYYIEYINTTIENNGLKSRIADLKKEIEKLKNSGADCSDKQTELSELETKYAKLVEIFADFYEIFPDGNFQDRLELLKTHINKEGGLIKKEFTSIIEADLFLFGLIYSVLFLGKNVDVKNENLKNELNNATITFLDDEKHKKSPNSFAYIRKRLKTSIDIYGKYNSNT